VFSCKWISFAQRLNFYEDDFTICLFNYCIRFASIGLGPNPLLIVVLQDNFGGSTAVWKIDDIVDTTYNLPNGANGISLFATQRFGCC
jgi:hypothetical protein